MLTYMSQLISTTGIKVSHYINAGVGIITGLAWKEFIQSMLNTLLPTPGEVLSHFLNAIIITVILVLVIVLLPDTETEMPDPAKVKIMEEKIKLQEKSISKLREHIEDSRLY